MKKIAIAAVLGIAGVVLAHMHVQMQRYYPMVKLSSPEGLTFIAVQDVTGERRACGDANDRFLQPVKARCKDCKVVAARCERVVDGDEERALLEGRALPGYLVVAPGVRLSISGPDASARANCEYIAADMRKRGVSGAACLSPRKETGSVSGV
jgi:hypothetical protein